MIRDAILGATPVAALQNGTYLAVCVAIGLIIFRTAKYWMHLRNLIQFGDAVGLGVFTAIGAAKAIQYNVGFAGVLLCGVFTAIGGGMIRDILTGEIPTVLKSDFYATAALMGGSLYFALYRLEVNWFLNFLVTFAFVTLVRILAMHYHLKLPRAHNGGVHRRRSTADK